VHCFWIDKNRYAVITNEYRDLVLRKFSFNSVAYGLEKLLKCAITLRTNPRADE